MSLKDWMKKVESAQISENIAPQVATTKPGMNPTATQQTAQNTSKLSQGLSKVGITQNTTGLAKALSAPGGANAPAQDKAIAGVAKNIGLDKILADPGSVSKLAPMVKNVAADNTQQSNQPNQTGIQEDEVMEVAPPGMEDVVLALKKKFPGQEGRAYAIAWSNYNKKHGKKDAKESMMAESKQLNEGTLEEILSNHPHEHKMCQEGWGMDNSLFEALADHYFKEGRIPRSVWHGSAEELREFVESCYAEDTMGTNEDMINSGMLDEEDVTEGAKEQYTINPGKMSDAERKRLADRRKFMGKMAAGVIGTAIASPAIYNSDYVTNKRLPPEITIPQIKRRMALLKQEFVKKSISDHEYAKKMADYERQIMQIVYDNPNDEYVANNYGYVPPQKSPKPTKNIKEMSRLERMLTQETTEENTMYESKKSKKAVEEAVEKTKTGLKHKADAGGYGRRHEDDEDEDGKKVKKDEPKKGRGRPKKTDNASGEDKKFDFSALDKLSGSKKPKSDKWDKKKTTKVTKMKDGDKNDKEELDEATRYNDAHQELFAKNPNLNRQDREAVTVGGRIVSKVTPQTKRPPVKKNQMTPFSAKIGETLKGGQKKLDKNKNGKIDGGDFAMLRGQKKKDAQMESWDRQLLSMLKEDAENVTYTAAPKQAATPVAQQGVTPGGDIMGLLQSLIQNAGLKGDQSTPTPTPDAAGGNQLDGSELQSGVDGPVNDKHSEPGSKDPRNNPIAGQVFVPQLAMPRGMGMSVEGDVHTHEIDIEPKNPDEVQTTLAKDSDDAIIDGFKDLISRISGGNTRDGEAKLIVPYGDYAQEVGGETARDHQDVKQPNASVGVQGADDLDSIKHLAGTGGGILPANLEEGDIASTFEDDSTFGHAVQEEETFGHTTASPASTGQNQAAVQEDGDMAGTFEDSAAGNQIDAELATSLMQKLEALLSNMTDDETADVEDDSEDEDKEESIEVDTEEESEDDGDEEDSEEDSEEKVEEGRQPCNECGLSESKCECPVNEGKIFTNLLKMFEEAKPDFADIDKDGDEKETMKKAAKDKKAKEAKEAKKDTKDVEKLDEWANSPGGESEDEAFIADMDFMTKVISGGLNKMKKDQTVLPNTRVDTKTESTEVESDGEMKQMKKLAGLK